MRFDNAKSAVETEPAGGVPQVERDRDVAILADGFDSVDPLDAGPRRPAADVLPGNGVPALPYKDGYPEFESLR